ncbi:hypothetical protein N7541_004681 [Penicillium brevicompactum]|uniref:RRM domain-containing protein n=1 Tax=Penicillium brevicompactum TaxID=5074 RepID=A0A9W9RHC4_PENBR|nr:hypothetical protein N7541_004681 [Penicillium brevicompactum]
MATDDDNFDIDIYGDGTYSANDATTQDDSELALDVPGNLPASSSGAIDRSDPQSSNVADQSQAQRPAPQAQPTQPTQPTQQVNSTSGPQQQASTHALPAPPQGTKRKEIDEPSDPSATNALQLGELAWWKTEEDVRGTINQAGVESELKELTFSEHKVNGKSKGQVYVKFTTPQAATAAKHAIEQTGEPGRKHTAIYANPNVNPYKTLPKDTPMRAGPNARGGYQGGSNFGHNNAGNFRGGRGNYNNNRGNYNNYNNRGGHNNFNQMPFQGNPNPMMGNFTGGMGGMPNYGFNNRGGHMMGNPMRGGPGNRGRGGNHMGGHNMMPMGMNPAMNAMGGMGPMNMMQGMGANMGGNMAMPGQPPFQGGPAQPFNQGQGQNPGAFFNGHQGGPGSNPHGAKRSRQD